MKRYLAGVVLLLSFHPSLRAQHSFVAHEWGTFTTLAGTDGILLPGLYHEEEVLPNFVDHFSEPYSNGHNKGYYECAGVTIKMETPVIYFYSDTARSVSVRVDWPAGSISQWYPYQSAGEQTQININDTVHFEDTAHNGWIKWNVDILPKSPNDTLGLWKSGETHTWEAPRATDANTIGNTFYKGKYENVEKYLFYRGIGNAKFMDASYDGHLLLDTKFDHDTLVIDNLTYYGIQSAFVYELSEDSTTQYVWWSGHIGGGAEVRCHRSVPCTEGTFESTLSDFKSNLVEAGLYDKEAAAMIDTWKQSYFGKPGLRVFWIVPRLSTDRSLPLSISPQPDSIERVLVARSEIITPEFEKKLMTDSIWNYYGDRYYLAYQTRAAAMKAASAVSPNGVTPENISVYPNPTSGIFTVAFAAKPLNVRFEIVNAAGSQRIVPSRQSGNTMHLDLSNLPSGVYLLRIQSDQGTSMKRIVKE